MLCSQNVKKYNKHKHFQVCHLLLLGNYDINHFWSSHDPEESNQTINCFWNTKLFWRILLLIWQEAPSLQPNEIILKSAHTELGSINFSSFNLSSGTKPHDCWYFNTYTSNWLWWNMYEFKSCANLIWISWIYRNKWYL